MQTKLHFNYFMGVREVTMDIFRKKERRMYIEKSREQPRKTDFIFAQKKTFSVPAFPVAGGVLGSDRNWMN
jgi:hypothetical protein